MYPRLFLRECLVRLLQVGEESMGDMEGMEYMDMVEMDEDVKEAKVEIEFEDEDTGVVWGSRWSSHLGAAEGPSHHRASYTNAP